MSPEDEARVREIVNEVLDERGPVPDDGRILGDAVVEALREHTRRSGSISGVRVLGRKMCDNSVVYETINKYARPVVRALHNVGMHGPEHEG